jgi:hypothetical protein
MKKSVYPEKFSHLNCHDENVKDRYHKYNQASSKKIKSRCFTESIEVADGYFLSIMANIRINTSSGTVSIQNVFCFKGKQIKFG